MLLSHSSTVQNMCICCEQILSCLHIHCCSHGEPKKSENYTKTAQKMDDHKKSISNLLEVFACLNWVNYVWYTWVLEQTGIRI